MSKNESRLRFDIVGNWSEVKLEILHQYAAAYQKILSAQQHRFSTVYIDAFAGAGQHVSKGTGDLIDGSPRIAVKTKPPFSKLHFIDLDGARAQYLRETFNDDARVQVHHGNCNEVLEKIIPTVRFDEFMRGLCLLDPYGLNLEWPTIKAAGESKTIDLILNFPVADMNRNVFWKNYHGVDIADIERMNRFWGDDSWKSLVWSKYRSLFDEEDDESWIEKTGSNNTIAEAFRQRLLNEAGFKCVPEPLAMKNSKGATVYYLYFASQKDVAQKIAKYLFNWAKGRM